MLMCKVLAGNFIIPKSVFDRLSFEINKMKDEGYSSNNTGYMSYLGDGKYYFHKDTPEEKRASINYANKLFKYLNAFKHDQNLYDLNDEDPKIDEIYTKINCIIEMDTIGIAKVKKDTIILSDDYIIWQFAIRNKIPCVGMLCFLKKLNLMIEDYFEKLKILANRNFGRYIHLNDLYAISDILLSDKPVEEKNGILQCFVNFLLIKFDDKEKQKYHELYINELYAIYYKAGKCLEKNMHSFFQKIALSFFQKNYPHEWNELMNRVNLKLNNSEFIYSLDEEGSIRISLVKKNNNISDKDEE